MPDPSTLRDSTQIVLPSDALEGVREDLTEKFTLTLFEMDGATDKGGATGKEETTDEGGTTERDETVGGHYVRIIGSPVEIKAATDFLSRHGVRLP